MRKQILPHSKELTYINVLNESGTVAKYTYFICDTVGDRGRIAQWLRCCATNRKVAGLIPAGVTGFFIDIKSFRSHYGPGVGSVSNRNEYREHFLGVKAAGA